MKYNKKPPNYKRNNSHPVILAHASIQSINTRRQAKPI